jgi:hypothetical protein
VHCAVEASCGLAFAMASKTVVWHAWCVGALLSASIPFTHTFQVRSDGSSRPYSEALQESRVQFASMLKSK